jgi:hypothetical protein
MPSYYYPLNRHAIVVKPKQPLLDWINALYPDMAKDGSETVVYLVKERQGYQHTETWLKKHFAGIFENELEGRHTDENDCRKKGLISCLPSGLIPKFTQL